MLVGEAPTWLADGTLATRRYVSDGEVVLRFADHGARAIAEVSVPDEVELSGREPVAAADGSGLFAIDPRDEGDPLRLVGWDGKAVARDPKLEAVLALGIERDGGLDGSTVYDWCTDGVDRSDCGTGWLWPSGRRTDVQVRGDYLVGTHAWWGDSGDLLIASLGKLWRVHPTGTRLRVTRVGSTADTGVRGYLAIAGASPTAVAVTDGWRTWRIELSDGTVDGPVPGTLALVVP